MLMLTSGDLSLLGVFVITKKKDFQKLTGRICLYYELHLEIKKIIDES